MKMRNLILVQWVYIIVGHFITCVDSYKHSQNQDLERFHHHHKGITWKPRYLPFCSLVVIPSLPSLTFGNQHRLLSIQFCHVEDVIYSSICRGFLFVCLSHTVIIISKLMFWLVEHVQVVLKFIYLFWERQRQHKRGRGKGRERGREKPKQAPCCQLRAWCGARTHKMWDHDLSWNRESDAQPTEPPRCPNFDLFLNRTISTYTCSIHYQHWFSRREMRKIMQSCIGSHSIPNGSSGFCPCNFFWLVNCQKEQE